MSLCASVFILCVFVRIGGTSLVFEQLSEIFQEIRSKTNHIEDENNKLLLKIKNVDKTMEMEIQKMTVQEEVFTEGINTEMKSLKDLRKKLCDKYNEESSIMQEIDEERQLNTEYKLVKSLLTEDIKLLEERELNGDAEMCKHLENNSTSTDEINLRQLTKDRKTEDDITLLQLAIKQSNNILNYNKEVRKELEQELANKQSLNERIKQSFEKKLADISNDVVMARKTSLSFNNKLELVSTEIEKLESELLNLTRENKSLVKDVKLLEDSLKSYEDDLECYRKHSEKIPNIDSLCDKTSHISRILC